MLTTLIRGLISSASHTTSLLMLAIVCGFFIGAMSPKAAALAEKHIDASIMILVFLLLFELPTKAIYKSLSNLRFISLAWGLNFVIMPCIGFVVAALFFHDQSWFFIGLVIYFMAPCTDWYLGFTRLAKGNVELGATLLPINMISQICLFPVYLLLFNSTLAIDYQIQLGMLVEWFLQPLFAAVICRLILHNFLKPLLILCRFGITGVLVALVAQIFAANANQLMMHINIVPWLLLAVFVFFILNYCIVELFAKYAKLDYPEHCLLAFTAGARNAPLMLALTAIVLPNQPLIYATISIGMLIEFPHLTALKAIFLRRHKNAINTKHSGSALST